MDSKTTYLAQLKGREFRDEAGQLCEFGPVPNDTPIIIIKTGAHNEFTCSYRDILSNLLSLKWTLL